jgi:electron transfer flavoprotein beta subunit
LKIKKADTMKILVCVKAVPEPDDVIRFAGGHPDVHADDGVNLRMNRFDEFAVEEAVRIKAAVPGASADVVCVGSAGAAKAVFRAVGMGADAGIHIIVDDSAAAGDAGFVSACIAHVAAPRGYDLILTGVMSEDMMQMATGSMLAERLGLPWAASVVAATLRQEAEGPSVYVERELEGGIKEMRLISLPALLTIQTGINEPRYPSVSHLLRARASGLTTINASSMNIMENPAAPAGYAFPRKTRQGRVLNGTPEKKAIQLLNILRDRNMFK